MLAYTFSKDSEMKLSFTMILGLLYVRVDVHILYSCDVSVCVHVNNKDIVHILYNSSKCYFYLQLYVIYNYTSILGGTERKLTKLGEQLNSSHVLDEIVYFKNYLIIIRSNPI